MQCNINPGFLTSATSDRSSWRTLYRKAVTEFEDTHVAALAHKRAVRKFNAQPSSSLGVWPCDSCSRVCSSRMGLFAHQKMHRVQSIRRFRRRSPCVCLCVCVCADNHPQLYSLTSREVLTLCFVINIVASMHRAI